MKKFFVVLLLCMLSCLAWGQERFTATVEFAVNTDFIIDNGHNYQFYQIDLPKIQENADKIDYVYLIGSASPEGDYSNNESLALKRSSKVFGQLSEFVPENKIIVNNNYELFMKKTGFSGYDYPKQRAVYIEFVFVEDKPIEHKVDTVYVNTIIEKKDTVFVVENKLIKEKKSNVSLYTDLVLDWFAIPSIGIEYTYGRFGVFADGAYSNWLDKKVIDANVGFRFYSGKKVNGLFIEVFGKYSSFDVTNHTKIVTPKVTKINNAFGACLGLGWRFNVSKHLGLSIYARGGYIKEIVQYQNSYNIITNENMIIIAPSYTDGGIRYFGLTNIGVNLIIKF